MKIHEKNQKSKPSLSDGAYNQKLELSYQQSASPNLTWTVPAEIKINISYNRQKHTMVLRTNIKLSKPHTIFEIQQYNLSELHQLELHDFQVFLILPKASLEIHEGILRYSSSARC